MEYEKQLARRIRAFRKLKRLTQTELPNQWEFPLQLLVQ